MTSYDGIAGKHLHPMHGLSANCLAIVAADTNGGGSHAFAWIPADDNVIFCNNGFEYLMRKAKLQKVLQTTKILGTPTSYLFSTRPRPPGDANEYLLHNVVAGDDAGTDNADGFLGNEK